MLLDSCTAAVVWSGIALSSNQTCLCVYMLQQARHQLTMSWVACHLILCCSILYLYCLPPHACCDLPLGIFTNNTPIREGGAIATLNNMHTGGLFLGNVTATGNIAATGGVLYGTDRSSITVANSSTFDGNTASINGGALACVDCVALTLLGLRMSSNKASSFGGALYVEASLAVQSTDAQYIGNRCVPNLSSLLCVVTDRSATCTVSVTHLGKSRNNLDSNTIPCALLLSNYIPNVKAFVAKVSLFQSIPVG